MDIGEQNRLLSRVLRRRGLRFPDLRLVESRSLAATIIWSVPTEAAASWVVWFLILKEVNLPGHVVGLTATVTSSFQVAGTFLLVAIALLPRINALELRPLGFLRHWLLLVPRPRIVRVIFGPIPVILTLSLVSVTLSLALAREGILISSRLTGHDVMSLLVGEQVFRDVRILFAISLGGYIFSLSSSLALLMAEYLSALQKIRMLLLPMLVRATTPLSILVGYSIWENMPIIGTLLIVNGIKRSFMTPLGSFVRLILSVLPNMISALASLVKIRGTVLGLSLLGALFLVLNAEVWQITSLLPLSKTIASASLVYILIIVLLIQSERHLLIEELYLKAWAARNSVTLDELLETGQQIKLDAENIRTAFEKPVSSTTYEFLIVLVRLFLKTTIFITIVPTIVFLGLLLFQTIIENQVIGVWLQGLVGSASSQPELPADDNWTLLRLKVAGFLSLISAASALGTLLGSRDALLEFVRRVYAPDIVLEKRLLIMDRVFQERIVTVREKWPLG